jgi:hypothetical protein
MKHLKRLFGTVIVLLSIFLYSCDKEVLTSPLTLDLAQEGSLSGYLFADLDLTKFGLEPAPTGTKILISVSYNQYGVSSQGRYIDSVKLDNTGYFQLKVPTTTSGVIVDIEPSTFVFNQIQEFNTSNASLKCIYSCNQKSVLLKAGGNSMVSSNYQWIPLGSKMLTISGMILGEFDESVAGLENVPANKSITFSCDGWSQTITTANDGSYTIEIPFDEYIYYYYNFTANKNVRSGEDFILKTYRYYTPSTGTFWKVFATNMANQNINVGNGEIVP